MTGAVASSSSAPTAELPRERAATVFMRGYDVGVFDDGSAPLVSPCEDLGLSGYWFIRSASASSLSVGARSDGDVRLASANFSLSQTFTFSYDNGYYHIISLVPFASGSVALGTTGMDLGEFNPYDHYATGADGWHSHDANNMWDYGDVLHLPLSMRQRGDVISWEGHVAIYLGNDMIIDAYGPVDVHSMWSRGVPRGVLRFYR